MEMRDYHDVPIPGRILQIIEKQIQPSDYLRSVDERESDEAEPAPEELPTPLPLTGDIKGADYKKSATNYCKFCFFFFFFFLNNHKNLYWHRGIEENDAISDILNISIVVSSYI